MWKPLDHYLGQEVVAIEGDEKGNWYIELVGGAHIVNIDGRKTKPTDLIGMVFETMTLSEDDTTLFFAIRDRVSNELISQKTVEFNPAKYAIYDKEVSDKAWNPQVTVVDIGSVLPKHPDDRIPPDPE